MRGPSLLRLFLVLGALVTLSGCIAPVTSQCSCTPFARRRWRFQSVDCPSIARDDRRAIEVAESVPTYVPERPRPLPPVMPADPVRIPFDSAAALSSIHALDVSSCAARGAPSGYGHALVTFEGDGSVSRVAVDGPAELSKETIACVGELLAHARAAPFDGASIRVGASFRLGHATNAQE